MTDQSPRPRRLSLSLDHWAVLTALVLAGLIWADLLPAVRW